MASVSAWTSDDLGHLQGALIALSEARVNEGVVVATFQYLEDTFTLDWNDDDGRYQIEAVE
jgi:hypothetical protein